MTRIKPPFEKRPSTPEELRAILAERFPPGASGTAAELRAAVAELSYGLGQPEEPGFYQDPRHTGLTWFSWFRPTWPPPLQPNGSYRSPLDTLQVTLPDTGERLNGPISIALQGIKLIGAKETQNEGYRIALVTRFLAKIEVEEALARTHRSEAIAGLFDALALWGRKLRDRIAALPQDCVFSDPDYSRELAKESPDLGGGPHWLGEQPTEIEEIYATTLEEIGNYGAEQAAKLRAQPPAQSTEEFWAPWLPPEGGGTPVRHGWLVKVLWHDVVRPRLERAARKPPALARLVHAPVTALLSAPKVREEGGQMALDLGLPQPCIIREVAGIPSASRGIELFKSIHAHRVLWHIVFAAHERAVSTPGWSPHLEYEGGYTALAEACGISGGKGAAKVRELVDLFSVLDLTFPGYSGGLLTRTVIEAKGHRRALLKIVPGTPLLPGYVHELRRVAGNASVAARREQDLMPLLPVPPTVGRANDAGPQATLQLLVVAHFRDHANDLAEGRGAPLPPDTWARLATEAHVPRSLTSRLLPHWLEDHQDGPAVLKRVDRNRYTLGDAHAAARAFLEDGGRRSLDSSEAGRRSAVKRAAARSKVGQK